MYNCCLQARWVIITTKLRYNQVLLTLTRYIVLNWNRCSGETTPNVSQVSTTTSLLFIYSLYSFNFSFMWFDHLPSSLSPSAPYSNTTAWFKNMMGASPSMWTILWVYTYRPWIILYTRIWTDSAFSLTFKWLTVSKKEPFALKGLYCLGERGIVSKPQTNTWPSGTEGGDYW